MRFMVEHQVSQLMATVMMNRGVSVEEAGRFLNPALTNLSYPARMFGMMQAAERLSRAITDGETVVCWADRDADGVAAGSIIYRYSHLCGCEFPVHIPHRDEGYGLSWAGLQHVKDTLDPSLIITVDAGISSVEEAAFCRELGIDLIITDHHTPGKTLPDALAIVNPHLATCPYSFKYLCGTGVAFCLALVTTKVLAGQGYFCDGGEPDLTELLPALALATVADVVDLKFENRNIVTEGLKLFYKNPGLRALASVAGLNTSVPPTSIQVAFNIAPRINAAGRMASPDLALELLCTDDDSEAHGLALELDQLNTQRTGTEAQIVEEAVAMIDADPSLLRNTIVLKGNWAHGVIGGCCAGPGAFLPPHDPSVRPR